MIMRYYKKSNGDYARLGRFTADIGSPLFGTYYVDLQTVFVSNNKDYVPCGESLEYCEKWLNEAGFSELTNNPIIAANGFPIADDGTSLIEFSR